MVGRYFIAEYTCTRSHVPRQNAKPVEARLWSCVRRTLTSIRARAYPSWFLFVRGPRTRGRGLGSRRRRNARSRARGSDERNAFPRNRNEIAYVRPVVPHARSRASRAYARPRASGKSARREFRPDGRAGGVSLGLSTRRLVSLALLLLFATAARVHTAGTRSARRWRPRALVRLAARSGRSHSAASLVLHGEWVGEPLPV